MSKKQLFTILGLIVLTAIIVGFFILRGQNKGNDLSNLIDNSDTNLFPFGDFSRERTIDNTGANPIADSGRDFSSTVQKIQAIGGGDGGAKNIVLISKDPVSGMGWVSDKDVLYFTKRATGHVYSFSADTSSTERISNITIPKVQNSEIGESGSLFSQYIDEDFDSIESVWGFVKDEQFKTEILPNNISSINLSPSGNKLFYTTDVVDSSIGIEINLVTKTSKRIFSSPIQKWGTQWFNANKIAFTTKPFGDSVGFLYFLNTNTGAFNKVLSKNGLTTLVSPSGKKVLYSESNSFGGFKTGIFDVENKTSQQFSLTTLPEKCVWESDEIIYCAVPQTVTRAIYPDEWYQGGLFFRDSIWRIDTSSFVNQRLFDTEDTISESVDAMNLKLSADSGYLFFINKQDLSLWGIEL